jgi:glycosyltransferase involved in cell wall biosynthesis
VISVVMPAYGRRELLEVALRSLARQEGAPPHEVVVVDDGADPDLDAWVAELSLPLAVRVLHHAVNRGRAAARNTGIGAARGDVVLFLDADMRVGARFLAAHAALHDGPDSVVLGRIVTARELPRSAWAAYSDSRGVRKVARGAEIPARYFMTGNSSVAAPLLDRAGGFDEDFDEYGGEDTEMGYRLERTGGRFRYADGAVAEHLDLHGVRATARRLRRYGERMLPLLVGKVPRARDELGLVLLDPIRPARDGAALVARKVIARIVARRAFWEPAARLGEHLPAALRWDALFDFVRAAAYLDGYRHARRAER